MQDDDPVTLAEACEIVFRDRITPATLRAEHARGRLEIARIGKRDFTTLRSARELYKRCLDERAGRDSISTQDASNGLSETDHALSAQAAARETVAALKRLSKPTSVGSTGRSRAQRH